MKYKDWFNEWLERYVKPSSKQWTYERYGATARLHLLPALGELELAEITPIEMQRLVSELTESGNRRTGKGLSPNTVKAVVSLLQNSLKAAHSFGLLPVYTANRISRPRIVEKEVACFSVAEQKRIERFVLGSGKPKLKGIVLCLYTGLRIGELLALTWSDIDFRGACLTVNRTRHDVYSGGVRHLVADTPKTASSRRKIPLSDAMVVLLRRMKREQRSEYVVAEHSRAVSIRSYQRSFELLLLKLGIPHKGFHALRHTFATRAMECGMDVKTLSEILGHKNATVTLNRYAHSLWEHKTAMMARLGNPL